MPYATTDMTQIMGIGSYVGEVRQSPDGQLYEWVEGVDGLGNPIGFWKGLLKAVKSVASKVLPYAKFLPGPYGQAITAAAEMAREAGILGIGEIAEGPDGQLYEWVEGVDGLGNPIGFGQARAPIAARGFGPFAQRLIPGSARSLQQLIPVAQRLIPGAARGLQQLIPVAQRLIPDAARGLQQLIPGAARGVSRVLPRIIPRIQYHIHLHVRPAIPTAPGLRPPVPTPGLQPPVPTPRVRRVRRVRRRR